MSKLRISNSVRYSCHFSIVTLYVFLNVALRNWMIQYGYNEDGNGLSIIFFNFPYFIFGYWFWFVVTEIVLHIQSRYKSSRVNFGCGMVFFIEFVIFVTSIEAGLFEYRDDKWYSLIILGISVSTFVNLIITFPSYVHNTKINSELVVINSKPMLTSTDLE